MTKVYLLVALLMFPTLALAQGANISGMDSSAQQHASNASPSADGWQFGFAPYAWIPAISGRTGTSTRNTDVFMSMGGRA